MAEMKPQDYADRVFLALCVWREARGESDEARAGIAYVVMNRVKAGGWWGKDILGVLFKKWQFSSLTDPKDAQLCTWPRGDEKSWQECLDIACQCIDGNLMNPIGKADSYHDVSIPAPKWATEDKFIRQIGRLRFFREQE